MSLHTLKKTFSRGQQKFSMAGNQITYISLWAFNPACYQEARGISDNPISKKSDLYRYSGSIEKWGISITKWL